MPLPSFNFLHLTVSEIYPEQDFKGQGHYGKVKGQIKVTIALPHPQLLSLPSINFLHLTVCDIA